VDQVVEVECVDLTRVELLEATTDVLELPLASGLFELKEIEDIRILGGSERLRGSGRLERRIETGQRGSLVLMQSQMVGPACSHWLHSFGVGPDLGEPVHVEDVAAREAAGRPGRRPEILGDPAGDVIPPARCLLLLENIPADRPVEHHQRGIERPRGVGLRFAYTALDAKRILQRDSSVASASPVERDVAS